MTEPRVLLIEDNALTRSLIGASLIDEPVALIEASSGLEGIERARVESPDIVLLDLGLPDLSGFAVAERLREGERRHVAILALAGLLEEADERRLALARFDEVITKPIDPARLREALRAQLQRRHAEAAVSFGSKRLLLVDDDPLQRKLATVRLSRLGFEVTCSAHGAHAMQLADEAPPDAIVSDVLMPQIDGFELCARLRADERFSQTKIILLTNSYLEESDRALARRVGADAYVHREPALKALIDALRAVFSQAPSERPSVSVPELQSERAERAARQLDKQVVLNVSLSRRAAILSAEIAILDGLARALADNRDPDSAIEAALSACFDAGRIEWGVMFTREPSGAWAHRSVGLRDPALRGALSAAARRFARGFDERETHERTVAELFGVELPGQMLVAPMRYREQTIGAMVFGVDAAPTHDQRAFATVVATQIALVLALSGTFAQLQRATQAERERVHVLESILDTIHEPIMVVDRDVRPVHWNRAAAAMPSSHLAREAHEWPAAGLLHADMSTPLRDDERPVLRALRGEDVDNCEVFVHRESDHPAWLSIAARPVRDDRGTITGAVIMTRDVTVEKRARAQQISADRLMSVGVLAAGVAHEINNPLTSMIAELEMALEDLDPSHPCHDRVRAAHDAAKRVRTISGDLKTLSRGDNDASEPVNVAHVLEVAVRMAAPEWRKCAKVRCEFAAIPDVLGNESRLVQVFLNLIVNAAQAIVPSEARDEQITIRTGNSADGAVLVEVSDTGCGMAGEVKARIFTPFFTTKPLGSGTGLGLSISHRIVTDAGGRIECDSVAGRGTTFRVFLPAIPRVSTSRGMRPLRDEARDVALLESDPLTRQLVARALSGTRPVVVVDHVDELWMRPPAELARTLVLCSSSDAQIVGAEALAALAEGSHGVALLGGASQPWLERFASLRKPFDAGAVKQFVKRLIEPITPERFMNTERSDA
jgi:signal transduction histidine kinase/DNA-binding response OmpR family regulator